MNLQTVAIAAVLILILFFTGKKFFKSLKSGSCGCGCEGGCSEKKDGPAVTIRESEEHR